MESASGVQEGRRASRQVWALTGLGLIAVTMVAGIFGWTLKRFEWERAKLDAEQLDMRSFIASCDGAMDEGRQSLRTLLSDAPVESTSGDWINRLQTLLQVELQQSPEGDSAAQLRHLEALTHALAKSHDKSAAWKHRYLKNRDAFEASLSATLTTLNALSESIGSLEGRGRLERVRSIRQFEKATPDEIPASAKKLLKSIATHAETSVMNAEVADLALLCERLSNETSADRLADLKDNQFATSIARLDREFAVADASNAAAIESCMALLQSFEIALYGEGFINDTQHQTIIPGTDGLYGACRDRLGLLEERAAVNQQIEESFRLVQSVHDRLQTALESRTLAAADQIEADLRGAMKKMGLFGALISVAFLVLSARIARILNRQVGALTESNAAMEAARMREAGFQHIIEQSLNEIFIFDAETLQFVSVNRGARENIGYTMDELRAMTPLDINPRLTMDQFLELVRPLHDKSKERIHFEAAHVRKDSTSYDVEVYLQRGRFGETDVIVALIHDITERNRADRALREAMNTAETANRAKSDFLANMSHEIRTPMTAILGYTELLKDPQYVAQNCHEAVDTIERNGRHLLTIINDILDLSKLEAGKMDVERIPCSVVQIASDVISLLRVRAEGKGLSLDVEYLFPVPGTIQSDPTRIRQILLNLIGNAIKFTEQGGVRLVVRCVNLDQPEGQISFEVVDTGLGMTPDQIERLFKPFNQGDTSMTRKFGGTGLGLTISQRFAKLLGGDITVSSVPGEGSTFTCTLKTGPIANVSLIHQAREAMPRTAETSLTSDVSEESSARGARILLAEDGPDNQRLIMFHLRKAGFSVTVKENGELAMQAALGALEAGEPYDVILMDMQMPVMDGYTATRMLRERDYTGPVVALTAHAMAGDREKCLEAGCNDYATKPINRVALIETVKQWIRRAAECEDAAA